MAASVKEKNMPTVSSNIYGGLQKWYNRASTSIRDRKRNRRHSDVTQTMHRPSPEMNGYQDYNQAKIAPVHVRSRSTPVMMPDPQNYLNTIEQTNRKTSEEQKTVNLQQEALMEPWGRRESKDDTSKPQRRRNTAGGAGTLRRSCSKSESSLLEAVQNCEALKSKSKTTPPKTRLRRTSSQDTEESLESCTSDLDVNYNINKISRSSQASSKANKRDRAQTVSSRFESNGTNRLHEKLRKSTSQEKLARDVKARLDRWVDKTTGFHDSRQASFESTSSSDDLSDHLLLKRDHSQPISNETREMRELQNALEELVSSCGGRSSRKSSDGEHQTGDSIEATNTRASRKISLKDASAVFGKAVDIDYNCSQSVRQKEYRSKKCGSSSGSAGSGGSNMEVFTTEKHETKSELEESYDSVDGKSGEIEGTVGSGIVKNYETKDSINCDDNIGRGSESVCVLSTTLENLTSEMNNQDNNVPTPVQASQNVGEGECQQEYKDNSSVPNETKQTEYNEQFSKQNLPVGGVRDETEDANKKPTKSSKSYRAPQPPRTKDSQERKSGKSDVLFNDLSLDAFAEECLRQADKKNSKPKRGESKSDSEEEKRGLKIDFVYMKSRDENETNLAQSYPGKVVHNKAATHPKTTFDENHLSFITLSDNELERNEIQSNSKIREKRNSADSLDGRVLFDLTTHYDTDSKNEDNHSSEGLQTDEELATGSDTRPGMRKFPSMPLFYVPKEFDQSNGDIKRIKHASIRKSIWKRIKSIPRQSENHRVNQNTKSRKKEDVSSAQTQQFLDPFYHGEKEEEILGQSFRTKAWTLSGSKISQPISRVRPSLETRRSAPVMKVEAVEQRDRFLNDYVVIPPKNDDESQC